MVAWVTSPWPPRAQGRVGLAEDMGVPVPLQRLPRAVAACEDLGSVGEADQGQVNSICQKKSGCQPLRILAGYGKAGHGWFFISHAKAP